MATAPYGVRLLIGAAVTAVEETRKLPQTIMTYPMTVISQAAHLVMRMQQNLAELVIKGDAALETVFPPNDEQPEWAMFDEDDADELSPSTDGDDARVSDGRFALYSAPTGDAVDDPKPAAAKKAAAKKAPASRAAKGAKAAKAEAPDIAGQLEYDALTLAQLRARLQSLSVPDLDALLAYEVATKARAPFQTLLTNRITRATAK